jgi:hypothetical protein
MGWITNQLRRIIKLENTEEDKAPSAHNSLASQSVWVQLKNGIQQDAEEFRRAGRECEFELSDKDQVCVLNTSARVAAVITADLDANIVEYDYQAEGDNVAVPEKGVLTIREHGGTEQLFSADQLVSPEQACQMILEPVLFPDLPTDQTVA